MVHGTQDWTKQESEDAEGIVTFSYRTEREDSPPDVATIQKQMAIVAWQPGPNRVVQVPTQVRPTLRLAAACSMHTNARCVPLVCLLHCAAALTTHIEVVCSLTCHIGMTQGAVCLHLHQLGSLRSTAHALNVCAQGFVLQNDHRACLRMGQDEIASLKDGEVRERTPARPPQRAFGPRRMGQVRAPPPSLWRPHTERQRSSRWCSGRIRHLP